MPKFDTIPNENWYTESEIMSKTMIHKRCFNNRVFKVYSSKKRFQDVYNENL